MIRFIDAFFGIPSVYLLKLVGKLFPGKIGLKEQYRRILLIKFWGIGNIFMLLPAIYALKERFSGCTIDILTLKSNDEAIKTIKLINKAYHIETSGPVSFLRTTADCLRALSGKSYDLIIDFEQFARFSAICCSLIKSWTSIGFMTKGQHRHFLYTHPVQYNNEMHITESFFSLVLSLGIGWEHYTRTLPSSIIEMPSSRFNWMPPDSGMLVVMHPGTSENFKERRWPSEYFAELADRLCDKYRVKIVFTGLPDEAGLVQETVTRMNSSESTVNLCGELNFTEFFSIIGVSDLVISADTATVHLASVLDVPVVGFYGPNTPLLYGPWGEKALAFYKGLPCSPCITNFNAKTNTCKHPDGIGACMKKIGVNEVLEGIEQSFLNSNAKRPATKTS